MSELDMFTPFNTTVQWNGYQCTKTYGSARKLSFRSNFYRSTGYKAKVDLMAEGSFQSRSEHSCRRPTDVDGARQADRSATETADLVIADVSKAKHLKVDALTISQISQISLMPSARRVELVREQFDAIWIVRGITCDQGISRVYRVRSRHFGSTIYGQVEVPSLSLTKMGDAMFFQFHFTYPNDKEVHCTLGWGHPRLIRLSPTAIVTVR